MKILRLVLGVLLAIMVAGCGGGGGDDNFDDDDGGSTGGALSENACGTLGLRVKPNIFTGTECGDEQRSPVVLLSVQFITGDVGGCSGTLITNRHVLTAGHCFAGNAANVVNVDVVVGGQIIPAARLAVDPLYQEGQTAIFNDLALVELASPTSVPPLPLLLSRAPQPGETIDIFGYGLDERGVFGTLRSGQMLLQDVTENHLVALYGNDGSNTCTGDSGGPAIQTLNGRPAVVGVTSSGVAEAECRVGDLSLFANTQKASSIDFITRNVPGVGAI